PVPLDRVARIQVMAGETLIARQDGRRRITVRCDIVGRDEGGFVTEAQRRFAERLEDKVPEGTRVAWVGMFENLQRARNHFQMVIPVTVLLVFLLLVLTFGSVRAALLLLLSAPFGLAGGLVALQVRGMNLNVSTGVGFAALFGVSIMNGVLMVRAINDLRRAGMPLDEAIVRGAGDCLRPILLASLVAILGLLPASMATGLGSDVQRPLATVIVWGLFGSAVLTLFIVPVLYGILTPSVRAGSATPAQGGAAALPVA
ncbi:MAG: efflux RND transporter permease subunit, partial [Gemmataceae bacterium]|nr:efflux RND transporter permease subunit [Gemmataceae bacterium]